MSTYFVTGTDTHVGKTTVGAALLYAAVARGLRAGALKPAESGCPLVEDELFPTDAAMLRRAAGGLQSMEEVCLYRYEPAVAPGVAAEAVGETIDFGVIREAVIGLDEHDFSLVEGAGGLLVPLGEGLMIVDLIEALDLSVIVVAREGLGTINHTLLTLEALRLRDIEVAGLVLNSIDGAPMSAIELNIDEIVRVSGVRVLGVFPHLGDDLEDPAGLAKAAEHLDLDALLAPGPKVN
jgi:dethiobiotin synthetase